MTSEPIDSITPINSASQSFVRPADEPSDGWRFVNPTTRWSDSSRLMAMIIALLITIAAHWVWRTTGGYFGYATFILIAAGLLYCGVRLVEFQRAESEGASPIRLNWGFGAVFLSVGIACLRMAWQGNNAVAIFAIFLLGLLSLCLHGRSLAIGRLISHTMVSSVDGMIAWIKLYDCIPLVSYYLRRWPWMIWGIPMLVGFLFLVPLTLAHPYLIHSISRWTSDLFEGFRIWLERWDFFEIVILALIAAMSMGMVLPTINVSIESTNRKKLPAKSCSDLIYSVIRNTLVAVIVIFSVFLVYEFSSLWFRTFPKDFHYSGYAHQGAAWLTIALAMSTVTLSIMFSPSTHLHPRVKPLQALAKLWFACNLFLVISVYHRLAIYVGYNGLTRMRIIGYVGVTCVLAGFVFVLYRVLRARSLGWLIHRQLWAFAISLLAPSIIPMDWIAHRWNASRIAVGSMSSAVQIAAHPISDEGLLCLFELVDSNEPLVRNGVLALLAKREMNWTREQILRTRGIATKESEANSAWGTFQGSTYLLKQKYASISDDLRPFRESISRQERAWKAFHEWAMQWY